MNRLILYIIIFWSVEYESPIPFLYADSQDIPKANSSHNQPELHLAIDGTSQIKKYEKISFRLGIKPEFANPYDPDEIDLSMKITTPSGKEILVAAFYYQPYEWKNIQHSGRDIDWMYPSENSQWSARFTPGELGTYSALAVWKKRYEDLFISGNFRCSGIR